MGGKKFSADFQLVFRLPKLFLFIGSASLVLMFIFLDHLCQPIGFLANRMGSSADSTSVKACRPLVKGLGMWGSIKALSRGYNYLMVVVIFAPVAFLAWFPFVTDFQTRLPFNPAFSRGLQIQRIEATSAMLKERIL
ncbi:hypothetical protein Vadar_002262 [Vaccinium darrowii]|uniref:Uncharacterized protein n=1 Tax=Vaccinium darrowii TaxID=229202 RepID=A0ACB7XMR2_9ERIC|nr:hypothetical protein Vadar_002262 [Vaccinium darrowii]